MGRALQSTIEIAGVLSPSLQAAINNAVNKLEEMSQETLDSAGAAEKLCAEMDAQESVLKSLQRGYADYVVAGQESSDEAQTLADKIQELSGELEDNRDTLKAAEKAAQRLAETQDDAGDAYSRLERTIQNQEDDLEALRREYANVVLEQGKTSKEAKTLESKISSLSGELKENKQRLQDVGEAAEDAGRKAENSSEGYTVLKNVIANLATDAIQAAVEAFKELATEGDTALGMLEARTGAAGQKMQGFEDVMYEVYNANYGESLGDVSEKLATVIQMTDDLDNASLSKVTKSAIALEDVFGFDVPESMRAVNSLMDQFGITSDQAFNLIVQGAQNGLNQNDDLLDTINEYSVQFKTAGYSADEMFNMLANGVDSGTWSVDKLGDAVKEFNIRASDGTVSDAIKENAKAFGLTWQEARTLSSEIEGGSVEAYQKLLDKLKEVDDDAQRYQLGVEMFGTMWEDLGEDAVFALMDTQGAISSTSDAMAKMDSAAYGTLESSLSQLGRTIKAEVVQPIADKLIPAAKAAVDFVNNNVAPAVDWILDNLPTISVVLAGVAAAVVAFKWTSIINGIKGIAAAFKAFGAMLAANPIGLIILGITALVAGFVYLWQNCDGFREFWINLWDNIKEAASAACEWIKDTWEKLKAATSSAWESIKSKMAEVWNGIKSGVSTAVNSVKSTVSNVWNSIKSVTSSVWNGIKSAIITPIKNAWSTVSGIISKLKNAFNFSWSLPHLKLPHISVSGGKAPFGIGGKGSLPSFSIEWYKDGGIMTNPTVFGVNPATGSLMAGGEAGAEAILPLAVLWDKMEAILRRILSSQSSTGGNSDEGLTSKAGELLTLDNFSLGSLSEGTSSVVVYYDFSHFTWSPQFQTTGTGDNDEDDFMARLRAHEAEFFDWLEEFVQMREVALYGA